MPETASKPLPSTAAEVAAAVLDEIENYPGAFDMNEWVRLDIPRLAPDQRPTCGTALCAAGWAAHVTGWTIVDLPGGETVDIPTTTAGSEFTETVGVYAEKNGDKRLIWDVAREALGLEERQTFWYDAPETALIRLRQIAGR
jgi:hypothetical protein